MSGLSSGEIHKLVNRYIGVSGGYLGDFSYRSHADFYLELDLKIDPYEMEGTTRERFIQILQQSGPRIQAIILQGILDRYPVGSSELRTNQRHDEVSSWIARLNSSGLIAAIQPRITTDTVNQAILDAETLIRNHGATSGVDRVHTALHGYLQALLNDEGIIYNDDAPMTTLYKLLRENHSKFRNLGVRTGEIDKVLRALSTIIDALNPIRNKASLAHPNENLLNEPEALLVINCSRTLLQYFNLLVAS